MYPQYIQKGKEKEREKTCVQHVIQKPIITVRACRGWWLVVAVANNMPPKTSVRARGGRWHRWVVVACCGWCQVVVAAADDMPPPKTSTFACFQGWREMCVSQSKKERNLTSVPYMLILHHCRCCCCCQLHPLLSSSFTLAAAAAAIVVVRSFQARFGGGGQASPFISSESGLQDHHTESKRGEEGSALLRS
jgi:hypothetical protein